MQSFGFIPIWGSAVPGWMVTVVRYGLPVAAIVAFKTGHKTIAAVAGGYSALYWFGAFTGIGGALTAVTPTVTVK